MDVVHGLEIVVSLFHDAAFQDLRSEQIVVVEAAACRCAFGHLLDIRAQPIKTLAVTPLHIECLVLAVDVVKMPRTIHTACEKLALPQCTIAGDIMGFIVVYFLTFAPQFWAIRLMARIDQDA